VVVNQLLVTEIGSEDVLEMAQVVDCSDTPSWQSNSPKEFDIE
jgi:hypothetical protein